jgi:cellulose synthase/poly-beta-1,6-N-acetylglucosamine synthase-like glycosyltransferase/peptidoglycan/xylan/chitin deacetylase (PgdA/CDA1 family)/spore germination protein YaaH
VISPPAATAPPVFLDPTGKRWRRIRRAALVLGALTTLAGGAIVAGILIPPLLPALTDTFHVKRNLSAVPKLSTTRRDRERIAAKRRLFVALERRRPALGVKTPFLPVKRVSHSVRSTGPVLPQSRAPPVNASTSSLSRRGEVAGFYVNWDDNSFASFEAHAALMDWVVCEWGFLTPSGDSVKLAIDRKVLYVAQRQPPAHRPRVLLMVGNFDSQTRSFDGARLRRLLSSPASRANVVRELANTVDQYGLAGVTLDFEEIPPDLDHALASFATELEASMHARGAIVSQALSTDMDSTAVRAYAAANDRLFLMLYDEHFRGSDPGPVASQDWYVAHARQLLRFVPAEKAILAIGGYGYDWNDGDSASSGSEMTFQDVMTEARRHRLRIQFDSTALNPFVTWTEPDSTDHLVWFLDAVTAYNEIDAARTMAVAGEAIWRLGSEDPGIWQVLRRDAAFPSANDVQEIPPGYDVQFDGEGEILHLAATPTRGLRTVRVNPITGLIDSEQLSQYPSPYVIERAGSSAHRVALTFDDGPDSRWTPAILDTLASRHAPATFFLIGTSVERHIPLSRRIVDEGHEFGNHTFTHPNLALTSPFVTRLELDANERLLEAVFDRRSAFFRPPYFGDAEPTTADELVPVSIAADLGYVTAGLHIDSDDWKELGANRIVQTVLDRRSRGNVVLLHDGGGDRSQTVAALGTIIDSLRARGDTLVLLSDLAGISREQAMPPLPPSSAATRLVELASFGVVGGLDWAMHWILLLAVALGAGRLVIIVSLALAHRYRKRRVFRNYTPSLSVIVPAYNEEVVINRTISSLLEQDYTGSVEIVVVDDGSLDGTYAFARSHHGDDPRVSIYTKANGGKASALNYGIARAHGEIIVGLDADTQFRRDTLRRLVEPLADARVGAVAGNAKVGNRINLITRWQAIEYVVSQNLDRRAFSLLDCITVVPGAVGAWRKSLVDEVGGFSHDTLAEDQDLTLSIRRAGYSIAYADDAIAYTEAPDTFGGLAKQRFRWSFGTLQCMWKHRDALFRSRYGTLGFVAMPNVWLFQLLFTALSPIADLLFLWSLLSVWLIKQQHGATYAVTNLEQVLTFYAVFLFVDWFASVIAFIAEPGEDKSLTWLVFLQRFAYRQIMYWVVLRSFVAAVRGHIVGWGKLERKASVEVPA